MRKPRLAVSVLIAIGVMLSASSPSFGAAATVNTSVQALDNGNFLIKLTVTATKSGIYAFELKDPKGSVVDVYAPKSWCMLSDGEVCLARTSNAPISVGKSVEFIIHSSAKDVKFVWTFFGPLEQIGKPEVL